jgi:hypothetical protein
MAGWGACCPGDIDQIVVCLQLSDDDVWLDGLAAGSDAILPAAAAPAEDEALAPEEASAVLAARGAVADTDVLQVHVATAGPFSRRGTYRWVAARDMSCAHACCPAGGA